MNYILMKNNFAVQIYESLPPIDMMARSIEGQVSPDQLSQILDEKEVMVGANRYELVWAEHMKLTVGPRNIGDTWLLWLVLIAQLTLVLLALTAS